MYRFALSIMKNHDDACDAVSEAVLHAYVNIGSLCFGEKFRSWIMTILYNVCITCLDRVYRIRILMLKRRCMSHRLKPI